MPRNMGPKCGVIISFQKILLRMLNTVSKLCFFQGPEKIEILWEVLTFHFVLLENRIELFYAKDEPGIG